MNASILLLLLLAMLASARANQVLKSTNNNANRAEDGYEQVGDFGYYKLTSEPTNWPGAWKSCATDGAHLLILRSQEEFQAIQSWAPEEIVFVPYGAHQRFDSGVITTMFDESPVAAGFDVWGEDISDHQVYNNDDYPVVQINLKAVGGPLGLYPTDNEQSTPFICKKNL